MLFSSHTRYRYICRKSVNQELFIENLYLWFMNFTFFFIIQISSDQEIETIKNSMYFLFYKDIEKRKKIYIVEKFKNIFKNVKNSPKIPFEKVI